MRTLYLFRILFWALLGAVLTMALLPAAQAPTVFASDKFNHMLAFVTLSVFARALWPRLSLRVLFAFLAAFGGMIEVLQWSLGHGRDADWMDFAVDVLAISLGLLAAQTVLSMRKSLAGLRDG
jgi:glycopeptide antibiotics resistance protein